MCVPTLALALGLSCANWLYPAAPTADQSARAAAIAPAPRAAFGAISRAATVADVARPTIDALSLARAPDWRSAARVTEGFRTIRDARVRHDPHRPWLPRRVTWLYPVDDCYVRAAAATEVLRVVRPDLAPPAKVFLFGQLKLKTEFAPGGTAYWSYHVALVVRAGDVVFVLDPAVDAAGPLTLPEWIAKQTEQPELTRIALCGGATYAPNDPCVPYVPAAADPRLAIDEVRNFEAEWRREVELGRRPEREIYASPPWSH